jgi:hypothetical protein
VNAIQPIKNASVPCNGCTVCCRKELIFLHPEHGDVVADYDAALTVNPITGKPGFAVRQRADGACVYLGESGCTIHDRAPAICRVFDCRAFLLGFGDRAGQRRALHDGSIDRETYNAARQRLTQVQS